MTSLEWYFTENSEWSVKKVVDVVLNLEVIGDDVPELLIEFTRADSWWAYKMRGHGQVTEQTDSLDPDESEKWRLQT